MTRARSSARFASPSGFTLTELMVASAVFMTVMGAILALTNAAQRVFRAQVEVADMQQRLRVGVDALTRNLLSAGAGAYTGPWVEPLSVHAAPVMPYRIGAGHSDAAAGIFYRSDAISVLHVPAGGSAPATDTYYLREDAASTSRQLRHDAGGADLPMIDQVAGLQFEYYDDAGIPITPASMQDGPWIPDRVHDAVFDADLLRIRRVRVTLHVRAAGAALRFPGRSLSAWPEGASYVGLFLPDQQILFDVAPRSLNLGR